MRPAASPAASGRVSVCMPQKAAPRPRSGTTCPRYASGERNERRAASGLTAAGATESRSYVVMGQATRGRLIAILALSLLLAACSQPAATAPAPTRATGNQTTSYLRPGAWRIGSVRAILTSAYPTNHVPPFDHTSTSAAKAQQLYHALLALPAMPAGTYNCPVDWGALYHVFFYDYRDASRLVAIATINPGGCNSVTLPDGSRRWTALSPDFWPVFASAMNVSLTTMRSSGPQPTGVSAPTTLPSSLFTAR